MAHPKPLPPVETLREYFSYDPETGVVARVRTNKYYPNGLGPVGSAEKHGHLVVRIGRSIYKLHRLAWKLHTGEEPPVRLDHANGNPADNRWCNLRPCSHAQNIANGKRRSVLLPGAYRIGRKFKASGKLDGKNVYLGLFKTEQEAHDAYVKWHREHYGEFSVFSRPSSLQLPDAG